MSQPKNSTELSDTQYPVQVDPASATTLFGVVPKENRHDVAAMLIAERRHASTWWTILNEMRQRRELPEWAVKMGAGTHPSYDKWDADCRASNLGLLAYNGHLMFAGQESSELAQGGVL